MPEISHGTKWWTMNGFRVVEAATLKVAELHDVPTKQVALTVGASGGLITTALMMAQSKKPVVIESPVYEPVWRGYEALGFEIRWLTRNRAEKYSLKPIIGKAAELTKDACCLVITNPNNPSGQYDDRETIKALAEAIKPAFLIVNEVYQPMVDGTTSVFAANDNVITLQSLTKSYAVGMPRFGWALVPENLADDLFQATFYIISNFSATSAAACIPVLENLEEFRINAKAHLKGRHVYVNNAIKAHPRLDWIRPAGDVIMGLLAIDGVSDDLAFARAFLEKRKVIMAPGKFFREPGTFRLGIGAPAEKFDDGFKLFLDFAMDYKE